MNDFYDIDYSRVVSIIFKNIDPEKIILFGLRGRGDNLPDSDMDILVIDNKSFSKERGRYSLRRSLRKALSEINVPKDILLYSIDEAEHRNNYPNHILFTCLKEGRVIYAKS